MSISVEEKHLLNKVRKLKEKSSTSEVHHLSNFLNIREQELYNSVFKNDPFFQLDGGYDEAEYKRAIYSTNYDFDFKIQILHATFDTTREITHRHVLGTIMSTGITRESVGDIVLNDNNIYVFVRETIANHLINDITSINKVNITFKKVKGIKIQNKDEICEKKIFVDSLRVDILLSKIYNINRSLTKELVKKEFVKVNQVLVNKPTKKVEVSSIVSVRKYGRFKIISESGTSKSGKKIVIINIFK